jgi:hypothetical protein
MTHKITLAAGLLAAAAFASPAFAADPFAGEDVYGNPVDEVLSLAGIEGGTASVPLAVTVTAGNALGALASPTPVESTGLYVQYQVQDKVQKVFTLTGKPAP